MAGFQVTLYGRIWVTAEEQLHLVMNGTEQGGLFSG
jgi:hypothetical protein